MPTPAAACSEQDLRCFLGGQSRPYAGHGAFLIKLSAKFHDDQFIVRHPTQPGIPASLQLSITRIAPNADSSPTTASPDVTFTTKLEDAEGRIIAKIHATKPTGNNTRRHRWYYDVSHSSSSHGRIDIGTAAPTRFLSGYTPHDVVFDRLTINRLVEVKPDDKDKPPTWRWELGVVVDVRILFNKGTTGSPS
ncbi:hypothetical protein CH063_00190 [Colletotrichum higginsianum]|uniref:Uncharacterized protein n=1 Tax=Colletotrichum higginsianum (strain IMI 349063) TaxID=759273 RepID=H1V410_COLHI|nr:hypothetical protein CH63R_14457 [Colletotrichum higginsianum IMI 349063]OBR02156.1 hypothetical protein CH63R_14457 [Colletotrichum higginsianum IMI 349063]CCF34962.1 hypothetical protein CH063_00190 [Colletotrichum higginsianum]